LLMLGIKQAGINHGGHLVVKIKTVGARGLLCDGAID
jgi:hypothetical protein